MSILSMFRKSKKENPADVAKRAMGVQERSQDKLPPPNLGISFLCECDEWLSSNLNNFNSVGGKEVVCVHCGAVTFLPPEILDHTTTDSKTATLKPDWQQMIRIVRHGRKQ